MKRLAPLAFLASMSLHATGIDVAVVGPVDAVDCRLRSVSVLGVPFTAVDRSVAQQICSSNPQPGISYVSALGIPNDSGVLELTAFKLLSAEGYVPGVSPVYVRGLVTRVDALTGKFSIRGATITTEQTVPTLDEYIEVVGSQPSGGGLVLSYAARPSDDSTGNHELGVIESSAGTGKFSSSGTGLNSSAGTGVLSSAGTGKFSSSGTGLHSSAGTGVLSSAGTGKFSSSGTGLNSSAGTGVLSSAGTGVLSSAGTGLNSSAGTGVLVPQAPGFLARQVLD